MTDKPLADTNTVTAISSSDADVAFTQKDILLGLANGMKLFHDTDGIGFADIEIDGHRETYAIKSKSFSDLLVNRFFRAKHSVPNPDAVQSALAVLNARARFDGSERQVYVRVGEHEGRIYVDLADDRWRAVEIDAQGWRVVHTPPIRFRRPAGIRSLPMPQRGGSLETLRSFLNVHDEDFVLVVGWLLASLRHLGPYPLLVISGEQGSAKSWLVRILKLLVDPTVAPLRALPRSDHELFIMAKNSHVLAFDNVSGLPNWMSDTLCRLATGGGYVTRQLYSDDEEAVFEAACPVLINGIEDMVARPDLADRSILLTLETIPENMRRPEKEIIERFGEEQPAILGALFDGMSEGIRRLPTVQLEQPPRMADFALWGTACETAYWSTGSFMDAYARNLSRAVDNVVDADPVAAAIRSLMLTRETWDGTATQLLSTLTQVLDSEQFGKNWPKEAASLSGRIRRASTFLRKLGIEILFFREGHGRERIIRITARAAQTILSAPSAPSAIEMHTDSPTTSGEDFVAWEDADSADSADVASEGHRGDQIAMPRLKDAA